MRKNYTNKGILYVIVLVVLVFVGLYLKNRSTTVPHVIPETPEEEVVTSQPQISIGTRNIKEENFSGTVATISGSSILAVTAREYIEKRVAEFKTDADIDVPDMREKFGDDSPTANYTIDIGATLVKSEQTESIVMSEGTYTGGASSNSLYKVITASQATGKILSLGDIIKNDKQNTFTDFVRKQLKAWRLKGVTGSIVFEEEVKNLTFNSFTNWSLDNNNLTLYFDKYQIAPGAAGAIAFPLGLSKIKDFLEPAYQ